jgi:hypothetical protein
LHEISLKASRAPEGAQFLQYESWAEVDSAICLGEHLIEIIDTIILAGDAKAFGLYRGNLSQSVLPPQILLNYPPFEDFGM